MGGSPWRWNGTHVGLSLLPSLQPQWGDWPAGTAGTLHGAKEAPSPGVGETEGVRHFLQELWPGCRKMSFVAHMYLELHRKGDSGKHCLWVKLTLNKATTISIVTKNSFQKFSSFNHPTHCNTLYVVTIPISHHIQSSHSEILSFSTYLSISGYHKVILPSGYLVMSGDILSCHDGG